MELNRREMILASAAAMLGITAIPKVVSARPINTEWFTKKHYLWLFDQINSRNSGEVIERSKFETHSEFQIGFHSELMRLTNIMERRTLDNHSRFWIVARPDMFTRQNNIFYLRSNLLFKNEINSGVFQFETLCGKWDVYSCDDFPDNKVMIGMGYRSVRRFRPIKERKSGDSGCYLGVPTSDNYSIITISNS